VSLGPGADEAALLREQFAALCAIPSPSGHERGCADHVAAFLRARGLAVEEDDAGTRLGGTAGNLLARLPGPGGDVPPVLLCAHLDTVPVAPPIEPRLDAEGRWSDGRGGVLGADDKATVAALLTLADRWSRLLPAPAPVELLLTVQEEPQLRGVAALDHRRLRSRVGYVVDHPSPIGGVVLGAPGHVRFDARLTGRAAHAGIAPEDGRSAVRAAARAILALPQGRLPDGATVNVGHVDSRPPAGEAGDEPVTNVVPAHARLVGEVRAPDAATLQATVDAVEAALHDAAHDADGPVDLDLVLETRFAPYRHRAAAPAVQVAEAALRRIGVRPRPFVDAGGSDANVLNARGIATVNLAGGNRDAHRPGESIDDADLLRTVELLAAVVEQHAAASVA